jgi:hypothetical protein
LPVLGGAVSSVLAHARGREAALVSYYAAMPFEQLEREICGRRLLSFNAKTGCSFDLPIAHTCKPTKICGSVCYVLRKGAPAAWQKSVGKRVRNLVFVRRADPLRVVEQLEREFASKRRYFARHRRVKLDYLRVNGTGDLFLELIPALNLFAERNPHIKVWIVTRRFELASLIVPRANVYLQLSLDVSTRAADRALADRLVETHPRAYRSFLLTAPDQDTLGAPVVFHEKRTRGLPRSTRDCPADAGRLALGNIRGMGGIACATCRRCFSERVLRVQRRVPHDELEVRAS